MKKKVFAEKGFIADFRDFILEGIPTNANWAECIALGVLSASMGYERFISTSIGRLRLNVWCLNIGPSGFAYKTAPLKEIAIPVLIKMSEKLSYPILLPSRYSIEGLIEYMAKGYSWGIIIRDEFTGLFKETSKDYLRDIMEFLSELYDGTIQKRYTRKAKLEEAVNVYVTLLGATTPYLFKIMRPDFFMQGTGNRILYIIYEGTKPRENLNAKDFFYDYDKDKRREDKIEDYAKSLAEVYFSPLKFFVFDDDAAEVILNFKIRKEIEAYRRFRRDIYDIRYLYSSRIWTHAMKLAGLHAISRVYKLAPKTSLSEIIVSKADAEYGVNRAELHEEYFNKMMELWRRRPEPIESRTLEEQSNLVLDLIKSGGMSWSQLRRRTRWTTKMWLEVLKYLWDTNSIIVVEGKSSSKGGRKPILFYVKTDKIVALQNGKEITDWNLLTVKLRLK